MSNCGATTAQKSISRILMKIGIPKEIKDKENRVAATPGAVRMFAAHGHTVIVETQAGMGSGFTDEDYRTAGARIVNTHQRVFEQADLILKVKEPTAAECPLLKPGQILFTFLHLAANPELTRQLQQHDVVAIAYETVQVGKRLPLLEPMSEIAGKMSVMVGAYHLSKAKGGKGVLLGGVPGVLPGKVVVLGGGTAGVNASRNATGLGADATILEVDLEKMRFLDLTLGTSTHTLYSNEHNLQAMLRDADLLIGAVLLPGARAPKLIQRTMLREMKPGSVLVDIAIDQGGCAETSKPTTHSHPTYTEEGILHYCVTNMPGAFARTATQALTHATAPYALRIADLGWEAACDQVPDLSLGLNVCRGEIVCAAVKAAL